MATADVSEDIDFMMAVFVIVAVAVKVAVKDSVGSRRPLCLLVRPGSGCPELSFAESIQVEGAVSSLA